MFKKILSISLALLCVILISACKSNDTISSNAGYSSENNESLAEYTSETSEIFFDIQNSSSINEQSSQSSTDESIPLDVGMTDESWEEFEREYQAELAANNASKDNVSEKPMEKEPLRCELDDTIALYDLASYLSDLLDNESEYVESIEVIGSYKATCTNKVGKKHHGDTVIEYEGTEAEVFIFDVSYYTSYGLVKEIIASRKLFDQYSYTVGFAHAYYKYGNNTDTRENSIAEIREDLDMCYVK